MGRSRRRRRNERRAQPVWPFVALAAVAALAVIAVIVVRQTAGDRVERDEGTMCPRGGPATVTAVLIDTTGNYDAATRRHVLRTLGNLLARSEPDDLLTVYEMRGDLPADHIEGREVEWTLPEALAEVCNPGDPGAANPVFENRRMIEQALRERYTEPLARLFSDLAARDALADWSPLLETIQIVGIDVFGRPEHEGIPRRMVMVSDLVQNSGRLTFSRGQGAARRGGGLPDYDRYRATPAARGLSANLEAVDVEILFIERESHAADAADGAGAVIDWWDRWFADQGATVTLVERMAGMG